MAGFVVLGLLATAAEGLHLLRRIAHDRIVTAQETWLVDDRDRCRPTVR